MATDQPLPCWVVACSQLEALESPYLARGSLKSKQANTMPVHMY